MSVLGLFFSLSLVFSFCHDYVKLIITFLAPATNLVSGIFQQTGKLIKDGLPGTKHRGGSMMIIEKGGNRIYVLTELNMNVLSVDVRPFNS